jgi:Trypsin
MNVRLDLLIQFEKRSCLMKKFVIMVGLVLVLALVALPAAAITWGEPDSQHTNVGAMIVDYPEWGLVPRCSGTLIHPQVFLTAGHCVFGFAANEAWVTFDQDGYHPANLIEVVEVVPHPNFPGPSSNRYDVGALILAEPVGIEPATLPALGFLDQLLSNGKLKEHGEKAKFTLVGYGATLDWPPPDIYYEDQRQFAQSEYRALLKSWLRLSQNRATGDGGTCYGDSGGPAFWTEEDGSEVLVGVTSWGDMQCVASGFNYRVDIPDTLDFIADVIASLD